MIDELALFPSPINYTVLEMKIGIHWSESNS